MFLSFFFTLCYDVFHKKAQSCLRVFALFATVLLEINSNDRKAMVSHQFKILNDYTVFYTVGICSKQVMDTFYNYKVYSYMLFCF